MFGEGGCARGQGLKRLAGSGRGVTGRQRLLDGRGKESDIQLLESISRQMQGETLCALGEFATSPVLSTIKYFPEEYKAKINGASSKSAQNEPETAEVAVAS